EYNQLIMEQDPESPHTYFSDACSFNEGDIFVDVGAAEGIISLDVIEKASEIYLIECSESWISALNNTFEDYQDKIHIIPKFAGRTNSDNSITIDTLLEKYTNKNIFIKMDVEGMELDILKGSVNTLLSNNCKLSCTTYHCHEAEQELSIFFDNLGYNHAPSDRYMLFYFGKMTLDNGKYAHIQSPYFRRALIRAWK
ncbi:MAG: FkbM family methyltransferase, partial [Butyrivibrio sp.]|nr:FkbM family methyltransferase [Butyrivibrio sp.]